MKKTIQEKIDEMMSINQMMKSAASMVGFNVDEETKSAKEKLDNRVVVNMHQESVIIGLKMALEK